MALFEVQVSSAAASALQQGSNGVPALFPNAGPLAGNAACAKGAAAVCRMAPDIQLMKDVVGPDVEASSADPGDELADTSPVGVGMGNGVPFVTASQKESCKAFKDALLPGAGQATTALDGVGKGSGVPSVTASPKVNCKVFGQKAPDTYMKKKGKRSNAALSQACVPAVPPFGEHGPEYACKATGMSVPKWYCGAPEDYVPWPFSEEEQQLRARPSINIQKESGSRH